jgi:hypothetical protein
MMMMFGRFPCADKPIPAEAAPVAASLTKSLLFIPY